MEVGRVTTKGSSLCRWVVSRLGSLVTRPSLRHSLARYTRFAHAVEREDERSEWGATQHKTNSHRTSVNLAS